MCWIGVEAGKENKDSMEALKAVLNTTDPEWVVASSTDDYIQGWKNYGQFLTCQMYLSKG